MDGDPHILEQSLSRRERALREKFVRLEKKLEGYQSQIDVVDNQREQLEERVINMEEFFEIKDEAVEKEIAEKPLEGKLKSMTRQAEKYKNLFIAERNNNRHRIETLEAMMSTVKAEMAARKEFDGFSNEMLSMNKESFHTELKIVSDKLTEAQNELFRQPREMKQSKLLVSPVQALPDNSLTNETSIKKTTPKEKLVAGAFKTEKDDFDFATATAHVSVLQSEEPETFQDLKKGPTPSTAAKVTVLTSSQLFTIGRGDSGDNIGRGDSSENEEDDIMYLSPRETSSTRSQQERAAPNKLSTAFPRDTIFSTLPQGTNISSKFTFSLRPPHASSPHKHKSPLPPTMPLSRESPSHTESYFKQVVPLPDEIQVVTGEEGLEVLFSERAKLYRFDADSGQWKERGVGDVKLLRHPQTGQGRVLMRREHIKKLCANHNINAGMELKANVGSDRSWVWYSPADYTEGEARPEKLAIKLKSAGIAGKFKEVFEDLKETLSSDIRPETEAAEDQQRGGCTLNEQFLSRFAAGSDAWACEVCLYVQNKAENSKCVVCNSGKPAAGSAELLSETAPDTPTSTSASVVESVEPNAFQDFNKDLTPATSVFQSTGVGGLSSLQLFTIGRGDSNEDKLDDETSLYPSETSSPSKPEVTPQKPSTPFSQERVSTNLNLPFGTKNPAKFTFSLQVSPKSPPRKPKSPLTPGSPLSPESPGHTEDDGPYFQPLIPLPEKVECRTGEEGQEVLFCDRCKLFRYDSDASQWKERGIGAMKILLNPSSGKYRILMRREHVFKLCANHIISADMELKPFPNSDRAWLWTALADFSEEVAAVETLGARFRTNEIATQFKDTFDRVLQSLTSNGGNVGSSAQLKGRQTYQDTKNEDEDCLIVYDVRASAANREKASRLWLPSNFFNSSKQEACSGCLGCREKPKETAKSNKEEDKPSTVTTQIPHSEENVQKPEKSEPFLHVFGESSIFGSVTFSSLKPKEGVILSQTHKEDSPKGFQGAGIQLFAEPSEDVEGQDNDKLHFEPVIPLPDEIQVVTGEEGLEVLFYERAKLYRFDADSGQWKERGVGDVKLLRHPQTGQGRVLMRREHIKKLCANHNTNAGMELKANVGSDRSWVWYTPADYAEGEARPEKLAIKLKSAQIAGKFKEVFENLKETLSSDIHPETEAAKDQQGTGCALYKQFLSTFAAASDVWTCEVCDLDNTAENSKCVACSSPKPAVGSAEPLSETRVVAPTSTRASLVESIEPNAFQDFNKHLTPATSVFQSPGVKGSSSSQLFTIGRGESNEDKFDDETYPSLSKTSSPSKPGVTPQKLSTPFSQESVSTNLNLPFGSNTPAKFIFSLQVSPKSPLRKPKSPLSPGSPLSPESPGHTEDDGPYFEPLIPLPEKVECRTGEEGQEVLFCDRCKLFRYDSEASQWKERGIGDIKILHNPSSGKYRILMRREHVFKLCANHIISEDMELKPFPNSDRAWLWTALGDFTEEVAAAETLGARFRTNEIATQFKDTFDKALQSLTSTEVNVGSSVQPEGRQTEQGTKKREEGDIAVVFEKGVSDELPNNFFGYEDSSSETSSSLSETVSSEQEQPTTKDVPEEKSTPSKSNFLFGSVSVSSLSLQSVAVSSFGSSPFNQKTQQKSPGFSGAGSQLFPTQNAKDDGGTTEGDHDPHFEPIIPLPDKIDVKTGEEDEEVMFSHRAKLYRFVAEDKQWKERGVGEIKLLRNRQSGKVGVLMRRDQVLKICANHQITTDMKLQPNAGSEKSWVWSTLADFSEQECKAEQLAVRFKSEDIAKQFKEKFEECQEMLKNQTSAKPIQEGKRQEEVKEDLFAKLKAAEGSWECDICMVPNDSDKVECVACGSLKPGAEPLQGQNKDMEPLFSFGTAASSTRSRFSFGTPTSSTRSRFSFGTPASSTRSRFSFGTPASSTRSRFSFGTPTSSTRSRFSFGTPASSTRSRFSFGTPTSSTRSRFSFGTPASSTRSRFPFGTPASSTRSRFSFGTPASSTRSRFSFGTPASSTRSRFPFGTAASSTRSRFSFGTPASSTRSRFSF